MVKLEDAVTARFESNGEKFEILVDPDLALLLRKGQEINLSDLLAAETVFKDSAKGLEQSSEVLNKVFATTDILEIAKKIVVNGEVHLTTEQKKKIREAKYRELIDFISRNAMNPQTNAPHPPQRIENALNEAKIKIDEMKGIDEQVPVIMKELSKIIPISMEHIQIAVKIPATYAAKAEHVLHKYKIVKEQWQGDGSLVAIVDIPAGIKQDLLNDFNKICHGEIETKILEK